MALIAKYTIENHPKFYEMYKLTEFTYNGIKQDNRNPLLLTFDGADGFKTGYTNAAGYGLVGSAERGNRRLILVLNGVESVRSRAQESLRLMDWGFNNFELVSFFKQNDLVFQADTWLGQEDQIGLISSKKIQVSIPKAQIPSISVDVLVEEPIQTPITKGQTVANLQISYADSKILFPLVAEKDISQKGFFSRITSALYYIILGSN